MKFLNKTGKPDKELLFLAVAALVLLFYIFLRDFSSIKYSVPNLAEQKQESFDRLVIAKPDQESVEFYKKEGSWFLSQGDWPADTVTVNRILDSLSRVELIDMVSEGSNQTLYSLDQEQRLTLTGYSQDQSQRQLFIGKSSDNSSYTFVLLPDNAAVYTIRGNLRQFLDKSEIDFRSKEVMSGDRSLIDRIEITGPQFSQTLYLNADNQWQDDAGQLYAETDVSSYISQFIGLRCTDFADQAPAATDWKITLSGGDQDLTVKMAGAEESGWPAITSAYPYPVILAATAGDTLSQGLTPEEPEKAATNASPVEAGIDN